MTELDWVAGADPTPMLESLRGQTTDRKLRLFACACCRRIGHLLADPDDNNALDLVERLADGLADPAELSAATDRTMNPAVLEATGARADMAAANASAASAALVGEASGDLDHPKGQGDYYAAQIGERTAQCRLIRDIFGNPFRPLTFDENWRTTTAVAIARPMYDSRDFSSMPILGDALQDAGCDNADILNHCRSPRPHVRGCWVVDLVLGQS